jgi:putative ABC transport system permease protein
MIINYLKIAVRNLFKQKLFSFINIFGLALSMSVCLLVLLRIKDQLSYDTFHPFPQRTFRIITELTNQQGNTARMARTPLPLAQKLTDDYNFIEKAVRIYPAAAQKAAGNTKELSIQPAFVDDDFFGVFGFTLQTGHVQTALTAPNSIVLSKETAEKFFGTGNAVGQTLSLGNMGNFQVTGVLNKPPTKSHISFDAYASMHSVPVLESTGKLPGKLTSWNSITDGYTYILLKKNAKEKQLAAAIEHISKDLIKQSKLKKKENLAFEVQPLQKIILGEELGYTLGQVGSKGKVLAEIAIALVILLSACFNYTNLSIARSLNRGKEIGIRKVSGARRLQVFVQFIIESLLMSLISLLVAYVMLHLLINYAPFSAELVPADMTIDYSLLLWFLLFSIFSGLLAGALPAWALSSFKPVEVLKNLSNIKLFGTNGFRKGLIITQFALSVIITIFTVIFSRQFAYMSNADPGFQREHIVTVPISPTNYPVLAQEVQQLPGITSVAATSAVPGSGASGKTVVRTDPGKEGVNIDYYHVDRHFISTMNLSLLAGNTFPENAGSAKENYIILNEVALKALQIPSPGQAIGQMIWLNDTTQVQIAGVIKNFYYMGLQFPYTPLVLRNQPQNFHFLTIQTTAHYPATLVQNIGTIWKKYNPQQSFTASWLNEELSQRHSARATISMLGFLAFIAITIACLGLLGIVTYTTEIRRKEVGVRKVMGASVMTIVSLLSKNFLQLVFIAGCIALPVGYLLGYLFLNIFANRIHLDAGILLISFSGILCMALLTIGIQVYRAAVANPVKSLRTE